MAFNVSSINAYTNETAQQLVKKAVLAGKTMSMVSVVPGIKYKETLNILDNTISVQNATCGFTSKGSVAFKQREIEVTALEVKESLCEKTLEQYFMGQWMKPGSPKDEELGAILADSYVEKIKEYNELNIWKGGIGSPGYGKIDGLISILSDEATRVTVELGSPDIMAGPFTSANIVSAVDAMVANIPEEILNKSDLTLFMSYANYNLYTAALRTANLYHYKGESGTDFECYIPGTSVKAVATHGLTSTDYMVLTFASNIVVGTDLLDEEEKFDIWYSKDNDEVRVNIQWKIGVEVYFPEHCVCNF
jgi:hypothetical protein